MAQHISVVHSRLADHVVRLNLEEARHHVPIDLHDDAQIIKVAIICRGENSDQFSTGEELEAVLLHLVSAADQIEIILLVEIFDDNFAKRVADTAVIFAPVNDIFLRVGRIGPQQVAEKSTVRHISRPQNLVDLLQIAEFRR